MSKIFQAIPAILADVEAIGKNRQNKQQGFAFRGIDDVMNTLHPLFAKHKVFPTCEVSEVTRSERETKNGGTMFCVTLKAKYTLHAEDGSSVTTEAAGEAMDMADKATNKALSSCYKYAMFQLLCIPTEAVDADAETPEPVRARSQQPAKPAERPAAQHAQAVAAEHGLRTADQLARDKAEDEQIADILAQIVTHTGYAVALQNLYDNTILPAYKGGSGRFREAIKSKVKPAFEAVMPKEPAMAGV